MKGLVPVHGFRDRETRRAPAKQERPEPRRGTTSPVGTWRGHLPRSLSEHSGGRTVTLQYTRRPSFSLVDPLVNQGRARSHEKAGVSSGAKREAAPGRAARDAGGTEARRSQPPARSPGEPANTDRTWDGRG